MNRIVIEKDRLLSRIFRILAVVGALAYIPSVYASVVQGYSILVAVDTVAYAVVIVVSIFPRIPYSIKLTLLIVLSAIVATLVLFITGAQGAGYIFLMVGILIAALFGSKGAVYGAIGSAAAVLAAYGIALSNGIEGFGLTPSSVAIIGANLLAFSLALSAIIQLLIGRLSETLEAHRALVRKLAQELKQKESLLQEVQHRVNNNMQTILSLMEWGDGEIGADRALRRRISILSAVNEHLYVRSNSLGASLLDVLRTVADIEAAEGGLIGPIVQDDGAPAFLKPQAAILIALSFGDSLAAVASLGFPVRVRLENQDGVSAILLLSDPEADTQLLAAAFGKLSQGPLAQAAADYVRLAVKAPSGDMGLGLALELR